MRHLLRVNTVCRSSSNILNTPTGSGTDFYKLYDKYGKELTLKPASENVVCLCRLLKILANFLNLFLHTGK